MTPPERKRFRKNSIFILLVMLSSCLAPAPLRAQVAGDGTVGTQANSQPIAPCTGGLCLITGGSARGGNLFHSFSQFSLPAGGEARFDTTGIAGIQNIISRVTGGSLSNINGTISVMGASSGANLFLINPNGILFGPNASLNLGGSFIASTANSLVFADGTQFSAAAPASSPLLTVSVPVGLQYGPNPGSIQVQGPGYNLGFDPSGAFDHNQPPPSGALSVQAGNTLALVGGDVAISGGNLLAPGGQIAVGSVGGGSTVSLTPNTSGWSLGYQGVGSFGDIALSQAALLDTSGPASGAIQVQGRTIRVTDGSLIVSDTLGSGTGAPVTLNATGALEVSGFDPNRLVTSSIITNANPSATGRGSNLTLTAGTVRVTDGGSIATSTFGSGTAGSLVVNAPNVEVKGSANLGYESLSTISTFVLPGATGQGGNLTLQTQNLSVTDGANLSATTFAAGNASQLKVQATNITLSGQSPLDGTASGLYALVFPGATGNGANLTITTQQLQVTGGANIAASTFGIGNAGTLTLNATDIQLTGTSTADNPSGVFVQSGRTATGNGGNVAVTTQNLSIRGGGTLSASTFGRGNAGTLSVKATDIEIAGTSGRGNPSGIFGQVETRATGQGRDVRIETDRLHLFNGGQIGTTTFGAGNAGNLTVQAGTVLLEGTSAETRSGLFAAAIARTGDGGNLSVAADRLIIQNGGAIGVSNFQSRNVLPPGQGAVGNIQVDVRSLTLDQDGRITADSAGGSRGNIAINATDLILMRRGSLISTNAQGRATGGNITLSTPFLVAPALENSDITANSVNNRGGRVIVNARSLFGIQFQPQLTPESDITASSELGAEFNGIVQINTPDFDPTKGIVQLPAILSDPNARIAASCEAAQGNTFTITGRGGLPEDATQALRGRNVWADLRLSEQSANTHPISGDQARSPQAVSSPSEPPIVEARGWIRNAQGQVFLVADASHRREVGFVPPQCGKSVSP
jgi:filamentous hemagglutinin family protein